MVGRQVVVWMPKCPQDLEEIHVDSQSIVFMLVIIFIHVNRIKFRVSCVRGTFVPQIWFNSHYILFELQGSGRIPWCHRYPPASPCRRMSGK